MKVKTSSHYERGLILSLQHLKNCIYDKEFQYKGRFVNITNTTVINAS